MTRKQLLRLQLRALRLATWDRLIDLGNLAFPVFTVVGLILISAKIWMVVLGL